MKAIFWFIYEEQLIISKVKIFALPIAFYLASFLFRFKPFLSYLLWLFKRLLASLLFNDTALIQYSLNLLEAFIKVMTLRFMNLASNNKLIAFTYAIWVFCPEIIQYILIYCCTFSYFEPDLCFRVGSVDWLPSRTWGTHKIGLVLRFVDLDIFVRAPFVCSEKFLENVDWGSPQHY